MYIAAKEMNRTLIGLIDERFIFYILFVFRIQLCEIIETLKRKG